MKRYATVLVVLVLVLAGCSGGTGGEATTTEGADTTHVTTTDDGSTTDDSTDGDGSTGDGDSTDGDSADGQSRMDFYVSDEKNAMDDFARLNVTISKVGIKSASGNWTRFGVDNRTVDLTKLRGANATKLGTFAVGNGTYDTVFVHVSDVQGVLTNGDAVRVKLPSEKLQIHQSFTVAPNESLDYVFDVSVFKAGKSGKYILKPVISESGTDKEIEDVDERKGKKNGDDGEDGESDGEEKSDDGKQQDDDSKQQGDDGEDAAALNATFVGNVTAGENATVSVTQNGSAVANATVSVDGETVGQTSADGTLTFSVPNADELEVEIEAGEAATTLKKSLSEGGNGGGNGNGNGGN